MKTLFAALLWGLGCCACAADLPARVAIHYSMKAFIGEGEVNETLEIRQENGARRYHLTSDGHANGLLSLLHPGNIVRSSQGRITPQGLRPERFSDKRGDRQPNVAIFDWEKKLITLQDQGSEEQKPLPSNTQDRLSLFYTFAFSPPPDKMVEVYETDGRGLSLFRYAVTKEMLDTPLGRLETIVLTKQQEKDDHRGRKIWLAPAHHMLPVCIVATEKGSAVEQMVTKISYSETR